LLLCHGTVCVVGKMRDLILQLSKSSIYSTKPSVLSEFSPEVNLSVPNTLAGNGEEENVRLRFTDIKDFEPEQVARQIPQLRAMLAMRNLLRDLKSNLLDNATFRKELEAILKDPALSQELRDEMSALAPK
ncbi:type VI secretion system contractile sheath small subunit, partial [Klebsiella pneumoniae]